MSRCRSSSPGLRMRFSAPKRSWKPSVWRSAFITIRPSFPAANSSASRWRARSRPTPPFWSPTNRPAISTRQLAATSSSFCSAATANAAPHWFWSPTTMRSRPVAIASSACVPAGSKAAPAWRRRHDANFARAASTQACLYGLHGRAHSGLLALLWADQLSVFLRHHNDPRPDRNLAGECAPDLNGLRRRSGAAGLLGVRFSRQRRGLLAHRHDGLHVRFESFAVLAHAVGVSRLVAVSPCLSGLEDRL